MTGKRVIRQEGWNSRARLSLTVFLLMLGCSASAAAFDTPGNLKDGFDGRVQLGALATFGPTDSSAVSARTTFSYRGGGWEQELDAKYYQSAAESLVVQRDSEGEKVLDGQGLEIKELIRTTTNNRRFISVQSRRFINTKHYLFGLADLDVNRPANLDSSMRHVVGVGYKLWRAKNDQLSAGIGLGRKRRDDVSGVRQRGTIGYFGLRFKRKLSAKTALSLDFDSDFGSDNRYSEGEIALSVKLRDPVSLSVKYEARFNSTVIDPLNTFDRGLEAALSVNLSVAVF
ncbi:MAG: YdiY family protein [Granulosicoccus sp.]